ncbi:cbb3-type cytochrome oxidase subunit 3 [Nitrincola sp. MINF-07-Sa-05]|uniref:cbb3-type cytochrome oxidase subunit 3 n=1 Tax=Nitrincola salilacus TaxID=3400273 RepID=UPI0039182DEF
MSYDVYGPFLPLVMLITFLGIFVWVLLPQNKKSFDEAANLPFADDEQEADNNNSNEPAHDRREEK